MSSGKEIQRWADSQQYVREPIPEENRRKITVSLFNPPRNPLAHLVALNGIYKGEVIKSVNDPRITEESMRQALDDLLKTTLSGPLESIQFHFVIEGVTRSITHQMVRSRLSFFAQESLRFAVPEGDWTEEVPLPPHLVGVVVTPEDLDPINWDRLSEKQRQLITWDEAIESVRNAYDYLVNSGMPAEEARDLLPHAMPTRIHWVIDLRGLLLEAGKRTCTQAQFPWRVIFAEMAKELRKTFHNPSYLGEPGDAWQYQLLADKIRPACYQAGKCTFMAQFDRSCSIRERVEQNAAHNRPSSEWHTPHEIHRPVGDNREMIHIGTIQPIQDWEWAADPGAARI